MNNRFDIPTHILICETLDMEPTLTKPKVTCSVTLPSYFTFMRPPIKFHNERSFRAIEVNDVRAYRMPATKTRTVNLIRPQP